MVTDKKIELTLLDWPNQEVVEQKQYYICIYNQYLETTLEGYFKNKNEETEVWSDPVHHARKKMLLKRCITGVSFEKINQDGKWFLWIDNTAGDSFDIWFPKDQKNQCIALYKELQQWLLED